MVDSGEPIRYVYFPLDCMISTTTLMRDGSEVEVGTIGSNGMAGVQLILGIDRVPGKLICQIGGHALRGTADDFKKWCSSSPRFDAAMHRYCQAIVNALQQSIACNALHAVTARCARWLLLTQDSVHRSEFSLTQEFLAMMLGAARPSVTEAALELKETGLIDYHRGSIRILDRHKLEAASCECYFLEKERLAELFSQTSLPAR
ncbi:MAG: Crp/Fnr family transcriptional regulator [Candidatus Eremiobacteraeota bacterium]|nr:Crp/Fnr family transcriptional regulator [Candidatus Eremiobacteraeota bacterium]